MAKKTIEDIQVKGKRVLVRCDFNVPMDETRSSPTKTGCVARCPPSSI